MNTAETLIAYQRGIEAQLSEQKAAIDNQKAQIDSLKSELTRGVPGAGASEVKSFGEVAVADSSLLDFIKRKQRGSATVLFDRPIFEMQSKTLIDSSALGSSTPGVLSAQRVGDGIYHPPTRRHVRSLIPFTSTSMHAVEFLQEVSFTNAASPQTEGSAKAESALTFNIAHANVATIATWIPVTSQALDDLSILKAYIDVRLMDGLADAEDWELLVGDGYGQNLNGIYTQATAVAGTYATGGDTKIDKINNAIAELESYDYVADGVVVHPADWRAMNKIKTEEGGANQGTYVLGGPGQMAAKQLWDIPVVTTTAMAVGRFLVGQFRGSVQGYDRLQARIDVSNSHEDFFVKNKLVIRAEQRIALAVFRPAAFRKGTY